ncbi:MAG: 4-alpha-glucanotransferase, partial [Actinomycetota bacterium]
MIRRGDILAFDAPVDVELEDGTAFRKVLSLPPDTPFGYHRVVADGSVRDLIVGPEACYLPERLRVWGWALQTYALWSRDSWGIGDLGDLGRFAGAAASNGAGVLLLNPLHAAPPTEPYENSPYYPSSRCFLDPLYLNIEALAQAGGVEEKIRAEARSLTSTQRIDRDAVRAVKMTALEQIWERSPQARSHAEAFLTERGSALRGFASYMLLSET